ncbi:MAG: MATE family efflux transporter [Faecalibacterium sp.]
MKFPIAYPKPKIETPLLFSNKKLLLLLLPLLVEQTLVISVGVFDTMMVASLGEAAVSAVSLVDTINVLVIQVFAALATGGAVVVSQYIGNRAYDKAKSCAGQLVFLISVSSISMAAVLAIFCPQTLRLVFGTLEADVMSDAQTYLFITALSYPFIGLYNGVAALFRAQGNSKISMFASLCMNVVNVGGNALFIFGFHWGVFGAAFATLLSRIFAAGIVFVLLQMGQNPLRLDSLKSLLPEKTVVNRILSVGVPSGIENGMFQFGKLAVSGLVSTLGTAAIAANAVAGTLVSILNIPCSALGLGIITVVGQCIGAGEKEQAKYYSNRLMIYAYVAVVIPNLIAIFCMPYALPLFNLSAEAIAIATEVLLIFHFVSFFFFVPSFTVPCALRSAGDAKFTMWVSIFSVWAFRVVSSYIFVNVFGMGILGVWLGMFVDWIFRSIFYGARYLSWRWLNKRVI